MSRKSVKVQHTARLHEQAVQKIAAGEVNPIKLRGRDHAMGRSKRCESITVSRAVWNKVKEICSDPTRIEIVSATEVIIWSSAAQAAKMRARRRAKAA
jgi:hypothetical protein